MSYSHGIENLHTVHHILDGKRLGLITNPSAVDSRLHSTLDIRWCAYLLPSMEYVETSKQELSLQTKLTKKQKFP